MRGRHFKNLRSRAPLLVLMRHADAGLLRKSAIADAARRLTTRGTRTARLRARALKQRVLAFDAILTSPLSRAAETAAIVARAYRHEPDMLALLAPARPRARLVQHLRRLQARAILVVGHEPDLGRLASWLLAGRQRPFIELAKAGCCALSLREWRAGGATLLWLWD